MIWKRLKNLWELSSYRMKHRGVLENEISLEKDFPTIKHKLATIVEDKPDPFEDVEASQ